MAFDQQSYITSYCREHYDRVSIWLPKGYRERLKKLAGDSGMSMAEYMKKVIEKEEKF